MITRRNLIHAALFGAGAIGLRSLASGIPRNVLLDPLRAQAQEVGPMRTLILSTSSSGDPFNGNVPGTYGAGREGLVHPQAPEMAATGLRLGDRMTTAAKPWADLPQGVKDRMAFFHHSTYTNSHPNHPKMMRLMGGTARGEMLVSHFAKALAPVMMTTQQEPLSLGARGGGELLSFSGRTLSNVQPTALQQVLGSPTGPLGDLVSLRDSDVDRLHAIFKRDGTENQRRMLDRFAQSRREARAISEGLLTQLSEIEGNNAIDQVRAAPVLAAMNLTPVITIRIPFGGDNHSDANLTKETNETIAGVALFGDLVARIDGLRASGVLNHEVVVGSMNVFGRTLSRARKGYNGRDHNGRHHVTMLIGDAIKPGVYGGIEAVGTDYGATAMDSTTGQGRDGGDIPYDQTFGTVAKTMGKALGISNEALDEMIMTGRVLDAALK
jgi:hypothetical protein